MKLIVQIPCFNERDTLTQTIKDIPRTIDGIDKVLVLVVDDGSSDGTSEAARLAGADYIIRHRRNRGLAEAFRTGLNFSLKYGADIIVNTDGDNQYKGQDIAHLVQPIIAKQADVVVGDRQVLQISHFSPTKKALSRFGSIVVRRLSGLDIPDAVSGFRAISREAALKLNIVSSFSYTVEMLLQCGRKNLSVKTVPIGTNAKLRDSRLFKSIPQFIAYSLSIMVRIYAMMRPLRVFFSIGAILVLIGLLPFARFLYHYLFSSGDAAGHIQSLIFGGAVLMAGVLTFLIGLVSDLISFNRQLIEMTLERVRKIELILMKDQPVEPDETIVDHDEVILIKKGPDPS